MVDTNEQANLEDVTHMESPGDYTEKIATLLDGGDLTLECNLVPGDAAQEILTTVMQARAKKNWRIIAPGGLRRYSFAAFVTRLGRSFPHNGAMKLPATLTITGPVTPEVHP